MSIWMLPVIIVGLLVGGKFILNQIVSFIKTRELREIDDCPFKFVVRDGHVIFTLNTDTTLWCEYSFGIRSDGIYGISAIELRGINGSHGSINNLKIGQSVFPIIKAMDEFMTWARVKPFTSKFRDGFEGEWNAMKKKLDSLRVLESELDKKEKKNK